MSTVLRMYTQPMKSIVSKKSRLPNDPPNQLHLSCVCWRSTDPDRVDVLNRVVLLKVNLVRRAVEDHANDHATHPILLNPPDGTNCEVLVDIIPESATTGNRGLPGWKS